MEVDSREWILREINFAEQGLFGPASMAVKEKYEAKLALIDGKVSKVVYKGDDYYNNQINVSAGVPYNMTYNDFGQLTETKPAVSNTVNKNIPVSAPAGQGDIELKTLGLAGIGLLALIIFWR